ncbi:MAG: tetratricopeptide repeat protein [Candidatus Promineifilaceae bacterium]|jgi:tetratricopeptide (TPR) repeat protein
MSPDPRKRKSVRQNMIQEMRSSMLLPAALGLAILLAGAVVVIFSPWPFWITMTVVIGLMLLAYLLWSTRRASWGLRILAVAVAVPAIIGISIGLASGSTSAALLGVGVTVLLLTLLRFYQTPLSFRLANSRFRRGDMDGALELIDKSIAARPDFWESYQLRAMIFLAAMQLNHAERDAKKALEINPKAHPVYNTLGNIYLAQERFAEAEEAYGNALDLAPGFALYLYHLGLSEYRQGKYGDAAESFAAATQGTLPTAEYDLQARYYLARSLEELGENEKAALAEEQMLKFAYGLEPLQDMIGRQPDYPHLDQTRADIADIARRLEALPPAS